MPSVKNISAVRGAILEEVVLHLLKIVGYRIITDKQDGTRKGASGLEVQGRGAWHQIDGYAAHDHTPAFVYPIRLLMEAKCYKKKIGIEIIRNAVGVLKDISENYFTSLPSKPVVMPRYNFVSAIFSTSEFTKPAQQYAIAHQIFLIQYDSVFLFQSIKLGIMAIEDKYFKEKNISKIRAEIRDIFSQDDFLYDTLDVRENSCFTQEGIRQFHQRIHNPLKEIKGSYFGMLQGKWPLHLLSKSPLPATLFQNTDEVMCKIHGNTGSRKWTFVPSEYAQGDANYFSLEFDLPEEIYSIVQKQEDSLGVAAVKGENFSHIHITGVIENIKRQITLKLDVEWFEEYQKRYRKN